jgi:hypothetical protein
MLSSELRVEFGECIVLVLPNLDLVLQLHDELIFGSHLSSYVGPNHSQLSLESLDSLYSMQNVSFWRVLTPVA